MMLIPPMVFFQYISFPKLFYHSIHLFMRLKKIAAGISLLLLAACGTSTQKEATNSDASFDAFKERFMDIYWKQNPSAAIYIGYGKYCDTLKIPDSTAFAGDAAFNKLYLDSLHHFLYDDLSANNKIDYKILENQFRSSIWYIDTFKIQQWDPSSYNIGGECYEIITQNFAPLDVRLKILSKHIEHADEFYKAAFQMIRQPAREHTDLAIAQNKGSMSVFGDALIDSIKKSSLSIAEKDTLRKRMTITADAINDYVYRLKKLLDDKKAAFRSYRTGAELFNQKFKYDIVTDYSAKEIFDKAVAAKNIYHKEMYNIANELWSKYCGGTAKPADSLLLIKMVIDKIALHHASPQHFVDTVKKQVSDLQHFIIAKDLFNYDTSFPLQVRIMPAFMSGVSLASASFPPPYEKEAVTYYNVSDLTATPAAKAESALREYNDYTLQILSMHEAMPGHCMQGVYNSKSPDIIQSVFQNGAMVEGWAVYTQRMMLENGWANNAPEMWLMFYKWSLRECCNVIVDYGIHCMDYSKEDVVKLLKNEAFQEDAQIDEKYHRATVSQVQLCSYFTGASEIFALRDEYKNKMGDKFSLKNFHEKFLSYGSAPVKFIKEMMMQ